MFPVLLRAQIDILRLTRWAFSSLSCLLRASIEKMLRECQVENNREGLVEKYVESGTEERQNKKDSSSRAYFLQTISRLIKSSHFCKLREHQTPGVIKNNAAQHPLLRNEAVKNISQGTYKCEQCLPSQEKEVCAYAV